MTSTLFRTTSPRSDVDRRFQEIVDDLTRRGLLAGGLAAAVLGLSACGSDDSRSAEGSTDENGWTFTDDLGQEISLPKRPRRIAALSEVMTYSLYSAGLAPVAAPILAEGEKTLTSLGMSAADLARIVRINASAEDNAINLEALATAAPDLIIDDVQEGASYGLSQTPELTTLAPVVALNLQEVALEEGVSSVHRLLSSTGVALADVAAQARYDQVAADLREALQAKPGLRVAFGWGDQKQVQVNAQARWNYMLTLAGLGMEFTPVETTTDNTWSQSFSWESAADIDADLIVLTYYGVPTSPAWRTMPAAAAGQYVDMSDQWVVSSYAAYAGYLTTLLSAVRAAHPLR